MGQCRGEMRAIPSFTQLMMKTEIVNFLTLGEHYFRVLVKQRMKVVVPPF